jgi:hypothetical protein
MNWAQLWSVNEQGECPAADMLGVAHLIRRFIESRGGKLSITMLELRRSLLHYVFKRQHLRQNAIMMPYHDEYPDGWSSYHEDIWNQSIDFIYSATHWESEVIAPIFGTDVRTWESSILGWRTEICAFLPSWIQRSFETVKKFDTTYSAQHEEYDEEEESNIDPYLRDIEERNRHGMY